MGYWWTQEGEGAFGLIGDFLFFFMCILVVVSGGIGCCVWIGFLFVVDG
jgi:hypothetical protein